MSQLVQSALLLLIGCLGDLSVSLLSFQRRQGFQVSKTSKRKRKREHIRLEAIAISNSKRYSIYIYISIVFFFFFKRVSEWKSTEVSKVRLHLDSSGCGSSNRLSDIVRRLLNVGNLSHTQP